MSNIQLFDAELFKHFKKVQHKSCYVIIADEVNEHRFIIPDYILDPQDSTCDEAAVIEYAEVVFMNFQRIYSED